MSKAVKGSTPTNLHNVNAINVQRPRTIAAVPIRNDQARPNRPSSRGTPSRASNNSRGARVSEDRTGRSFDDTDDHVHYLSIQAIEGDAQSFQSLTLDRSQRREMATLIEKQRINARNKDVNNTSSGEIIASLNEFSQQLQLERHVTTSTEGLSDITFESDDGLGSDRTTTAFYMSNQGSPNKEGGGPTVRSLVRHMTDMSLDELAYVENYLKELKAEKQRRQLQQQQQQQFVDLQAIEARKQIRRSKSGGSEAAFSRKHSTSPGTGLERKGSGDIVNLSLNSLKLSGIEGQEPEDPEVLSLFLSNNNNNDGAIMMMAGNHPVTSHQPSPFNQVRLNSSSRGSGALHPGEKMFDPKLYVNGATPSPATTNAASNSAASNSAMHFLNSPNQLQSPIQTEGPFHSSRPGSRPASGGLASMLTTHATSSTATVTTSELPLSKPALQNHLKTAPVPPPTIAVPIAPIFNSIEREEEANNNTVMKAKKLLASSSGHRVTASREFVFSPSCAFDDISLGSQKSINSSRSSRTRLLGENGVGGGGEVLSSPGSTFSKHGHNNIGATVVKKTVYSSNDIPKKGKTKN